MKPMGVARQPLQWSVLWLMLCMTLLLSSVSSIVLASNVQVVGLFPGAAVLLIDGERKLLKAGRSEGDVTLISADGKQAVVDIAGQRQTLSLSRARSQGFSEAEKTIVRLVRNNDGHYWASGKINGRAVRMMLDTGASVISLGESDARRLGIRYRHGKRVNFSTANGLVKGYIINLSSVTVNGITRQNVKASVVPRNNTILLGMSFLRDVDMREENNILYLTPRY